ncbi:hypothetical protein DIPPA_21866 [Diplonema papillatum]|nr:hypothetical protein DIPPA_21866 [Diplonema papillatum]|eukprot:gene16905-25925_t
MGDVRDILGLEKKKQPKLWIAPPKPKAAKPAKDPVQAALNLHGDLGIQFEEKLREALQQRDAETHRDWRPPSAWTQSSFRHPLRPKDDLAVRSWHLAQDAPVDPHMYAKAEADCRKTRYFSFSADEYEAIESMLQQEQEGSDEPAKKKPKKDADPPKTETRRWTKDQTRQLFDVVKAHGTRWPVVADRMNATVFKESAPGTVFDEDNGFFTCIALRERYYSVSSALLKLRRLKVQTRGSKGAASNGQLTLTSSRKRHPLEATPYDREADAELDQRAKAAWQEIEMAMLAPARMSALRERLEYLKKIQRPMYDCCVETPEEAGKPTSLLAPLSARMFDKEQGKAAVRSAKPTTRYSRIAGLRTTSSVNEAIMSIELHHASKEVQNRVVQLRAALRYHQALDMALKKQETELAKVEKNVPASDLVDLMHKTHTMVIDR